MSIINKDTIFMQAAYQEALAAFEEDEVPVGAVVVCQDKIIGRGYNQTERLNDVTAHAEIIAITAAANYLGAKFLDECTLYVTLEPCVMCAGAIAWARPARLVFGAFDPKRGYTGISDRILHPKTEVAGGIEDEKCSALVKKFFQQKR